MEEKEIDKESEAEFNFYDMEPIRKRKRDTLYRMDKWAEKHHLKFLWQFAKFNVVGMITCVIQIVMMLLLTKICQLFPTTELPDILKTFFHENIIGKENTNWNYLIPFLATQITINTIGYFLNRRFTFRSDAKFYQFIFFIVFSIVLMFFTIWFSAVVSSWFKRIGITNSLSSTLGSLVAGVVQTFILFPVQKYIILREKKTQDLQN